MICVLCVRIIVFGVVVFVIFVRFVVGIVWFCGIGVRISSVLVRFSICRKSSRMLY